MRRGGKRLARKEVGEGGVLERFLVGLQGFIPSRRGGQEEREHLDDDALFVVLL